MASRPPPKLSDSYNALKVLLAPAVHLGLHSISEDQLDERERTALQALANRFPPRQAPISNREDQRSASSGKKRSAPTTRKDSPQEAPDTEAQEGDDISKPRKRSKTAGTPSTPDATPDGKGTAIQTVGTSRVSQSKNLIATPPYTPMKGGGPRFPANQMSPTSPSIAQGAIQNLSEAIQNATLSPPIAAYFSLYRTSDPHFFLNDITVLLCNASEARHQDLSALDSHLSRLVYNHEINGRLALDRVRRLFTMLAFADNRFGADPESRQEQASEMVQVFLAGYLGSRHEFTQQDNRRLATELIRDSSFLIKRGKVLRKLCDLFGTGCLFWLQAELTDSFLDDHNNRETFTSIDRHTISSMKQKVEKSGATALGNNIREVLRTERPISARRQMEG